MQRKHQTLAGVVPWCGLGVGNRYESEVRRGFPQGLDLPEPGTDTGGSLSVGERAHRLRPIAAPIAGLILAGLASSCGPDASGPPEVTANPDWRPAETAASEDALRVGNVAPREWLSVERTERAPAGTSLLFWDHQPAARDAAGRTYIADSETSRLLILDARLRPIASLRPTGGRGEELVRPVLVSAWRNDTLAAFEASGDIVLFDLWGRTFERLDAGLRVHVGAFTPGGRLVVARSPVLFPFDLVAPGDPLLAILDLAGATTARVDTVVPPPAGFWYSGIASNAGSVAVDSTGAFYFAWLVRPQIRKYDPAGRLLWVSDRPVPFPTDVPRLVPQGPGERPKLRLHTVHKGITMGPDGLLYARAAADTLGSADRLEVLDPATGEWLRSARLDTGSVVLAGQGGRIWEMPPVAFEPAESERRPAPAYALESLDGDTLRIEGARGRTLVVAFWASWCTPCQEELPLLDTLYRNTPRDRLEVHAISEDVRVEDARAFVESLGLSFPVLLGRGRMRAHYGYQGLPYTVLVDPRGRIARELYGFGGRDEFVSRVIPLIRREMESANP